MSPDIFLQQGEAPGAAAVAGAEQTKALGRVCTQGEGLAGPVST